MLSKNETPIPVVVLELKNTPFLRRASRSAVSSGESPS